MPPPAGGVAEPGRALVIRGGIPMGAVPRDQGTRREERWHRLTGADDTQSTSLRPRSS
jgi:hypothetical protein